MILKSHEIKIFKQEGGWYVNARSVITGPFSLTKALGEKRNLLDNQDNHFEPNVHQISETA